MDHTMQTAMECVIRQPHNNHDTEMFSALVGLCAGNQQWPVDSQSKGLVMLCFWVSLLLAYHTVQHSQVTGDMRHHDITVMWQQTNLTNPTMHLFHIPQCTIQNRNVDISVLNGALWDKQQLHCGICELGQSCMNHKISIQIAHALGNHFTIPSCLALYGNKDNMLWNKIPHDREHKDTGTLARGVGN